MPGWATRRRRRLHSERKLAAASDLASGAFREAQDASDSATRHPEERRLAPTAKRWRAWRG
eukprot:5242052-Pyramimonas_sp.AAC.1